MRFIVIGTGFGEEHVRWISECPEAEVTALGYATDRARAEQIARRFGVARITDDPIAAISGGEVDAVAVVTPPDRHERYVAAALERGLPVVVDKPLAHDLDAARRVAHAAGAAGVDTTVVFQWRCHPGFAELRRLVQHGGLGVVHHVEFDFANAFFVEVGSTTTWRNSREQAGAGALGDLGVHVLDLLRWISGREWDVEFSRGATVSPLLGDARPPSDTEDRADVLLAARDAPVSARVSVSRLAVGRHRIAAALHGTSATADLVVDLVTGRADLTVRRQDGTEEISAPSGPPLPNPYPAIVGGDGTAATFGDALAAQELLAAASASASQPT